LKLKLKHNLGDVELEEALEKALKGIKSYEEPNREFPEQVMNEAIAEGNAIATKVFDSMLTKIKEVITKK
jgi:hypothetical protein